MVHHLSSCITFASVNTPQLSRFAATLSRPVQVSSKLPSHLVVPAASSSSMWWELGRQSQSCIPLSTCLQPSDGCRSQSIADLHRLTSCSSRKPKWRMCTASFPSQQEAHGLGQGVTADCQEEILKLNLHDDKRTGRVGGPVHLPGGLFLPRPPSPHFAATAMSLDREEWELLLGQCEALAALIAPQSFCLFHSCHRETLCATRESSQAAKVNFYTFYTC